MTPEEMKRATEPETASPAVRKAMWKFHRAMWLRRMCERDYEAADFHDEEAKRLFEALRR